MDKVSIVIEHFRYSTGYVMIHSYIGFFFQAEDGIRDLVRSRGLGDVYKRQILTLSKIRLTYAAIIARNKMLDTCI